MGSGDLNGGRQLSAGNSPGKGPEMWENPTYSGRVRRPHS